MFSYCRCSDKWKEKTNSQRVEVDCPYTRIRINILLIVHNEWDGILESIFSWWFGWDWDWGDVEYSNIHAVDRLFDYWNYFWFSIHETIFQTRQFVDDIQGLCFIIHFRKRYFTIISPCRLLITNWLFSAMDFTSVWGWMLHRQHQLQLRCEVFHFDLW